MRLATDGCRWLRAVLALCLAAVPLTAPGAPLPEFRDDLSEDELGFLLAHEMAHVLCEHTREFATAARYFVDNGLDREYWDIQRELDASLLAKLPSASSSGLVGTHPGRMQRVRQAATMLQTANILRDRARGEP